MVYRTIKFKATNDAHIGLFWGPRRTDGGVVELPDEFYEIVLGGWGNTQSVIRESSGGENNAITEGAICDGEEWVYVTVAQVGGDTIVVSLGEVAGENVFM